MNNDVWNQWNGKWEWILSAAKTRSWFVKPLQIKPPVDLWEIIELEEKLGFKYPNEFKQVLIKYSGGVHFYWSASNEPRPIEFKDTFGANHYLWDFNLLNEYSYWMTKDNACLDKNNPMYDEICHNRVPFLHILNGDELAFDVSNGLDNCPVVYLNHEDDLLHGAKLADNFVEFITLWSNIGCPGGESWQLEPFYNIDKQKLMEDEPIVKKWKHWINNAG